MNGSRVRAVFDPKRTDDLKPEAAVIVGRTFIWDQAWTITPEDDICGGRYDGQDAWMFSWVQDEGEGVYPNGVAWAPTEDLRVIDVLR